MADGWQSMMDNLPATTGRSADEWFAILDASGLQKHGEQLNHLKSEYGLSHGFANEIAICFRARDVSQDDDDLIDAQYVGAKTPLRPIADAVIAAVSGFGPDVDVSPKKTGISLRRAKQFALIEVPSAKRVQLGIQLKGDPTTDRLLAGNAMCSHKVNLSGVDDLDPELLGWLRAAYDRAG